MLCRCTVAGRESERESNTCVRAHLCSAPRVSCRTRCSPLLISHAGTHTYTHTHTLSLSPSLQIRSVSRAGISGFLSLCRVCTHSFTFVPPLSAHSTQQQQQQHCIRALSKDNTKQNCWQSVGGFTGCRAMVITGS